jgi:hypothetical protein
MGGMGVSAAHGCGAGANLEPAAQSGAAMNARLRRLTGADKAQAAAFAKQRAGCSSRLSHATAALILACVTPSGRKCQGGAACKVAGASGRLVRPVQPCSIASRQT